MKVVLDTNVLVSGLLYPSSVPGRIVAAWREARFELVTSREQLTELARVLSYPKIALRLRWPRGRVEQFLKQIYLRSVGVELTGREEADVPTDPTDSPILATLVAAGAQCLVTGDTDLLVLRDRYPIQTPAEFVKRL